MSGIRTFKLVCLESEFQNFWCCPGSTGRTVRDSSRCRKSEDGGKPDPGGRRSKFWARQVRRINIVQLPRSKPAWTRLTVPARNQKGVTPLHFARFGSIRTGFALSNEARFWSTVWGLTIGSLILARSTLGKRKRVHHGDRAGSQQTPRHPVASPDFTSTDGLSGSRNGRRRPGGRARNSIGNAGYNFRNALAICHRESLDDHRLDSQYKQKKTYRQEK